MSDTTSVCVHVRVCLC